MKSKSLIWFVAGILLMLVLAQGVQAVETYSFMRQWGSMGSSDGQFLSAYGLAINSSGYVYVSDINSALSRIQIFSSDGTYVGKWG